MPGPGAYDTKTIKDGDPSTIGSKAGVSTDDPSNQQSSIKNANPFLSSTSRGDMWRNQMNAPFTRATFLKNPGPGYYNKGKKNEDIK